MNRKHRPAEPKPITFLRWLNAALRDERWRAFIRTQLQQSELPVIEAAEKRPKHGATS